MPGEQEGPEKSRNNPFSRLRFRLERFARKKPAEFNRNTTLEEQLKAAGMPTREIQLTTEQQARKSRAEELRLQREERAQAREKSGITPKWGIIEELTYREMINNGKIKDAEKYKEFVLGAIEKEKEGKK